MEFRIGPSHNRKCISTHFFTTFFLRIVYVMCNTTSHYNFLEWRSYVCNLLLRSLISVLDGYLKIVLIDACLCKCQFGMPEINFDKKKVNVNFPAFCSLQRKNLVLSFIPHPLKTFCTLCKVQKTFSHFFSLPLTFTSSSSYFSSNNFE